jgi:hypothetical protein
MGNAIPRQHPAVVLRSQFNLVRALLGVALVALVGMTIALVIVANDDEVETATPAVQMPALPAYPTPEAGSPGASREYSGPSATRRLDGSTDIPSPVPVAPGTRYDGGPEEGTRGPVKDYSMNSATGDVAPVSPPAPSTRYDGGPEEGSRSPLTSRIPND